MGAAMEKNKDEAVLKDWEVALGDLTSRTQESRKLVKSVAHITDKEMVDILDTPLCRPALETHFLCV